MPKKKYLVDLSADERETLRKLVRRGKHSSRKVTRARILLLASGGATDEQIVAALSCGINTVERTRRRFVEEGLGCLNERPRRGQARKLTGRQEAHLVAAACSTPPGGRARWTLRLLADKVVELGFASTIARETVRQALKKNELKPWLKQQWCIGEVNSEFVACMEDVLDLYAGPYDERRPTVGFDEASKQLIAETRAPLPAKAGQPERYDYEYRRNGVRNLFLFCEPLRGYRHVAVTEQRTMQDFAHQMKWLVDEAYPEAEVVRVVLDNLNTHRAASLYETFAPEEARRIAKKLEFHYTPKHGSWLNIAEIELSVFSRQCLDRRIGDEEMLRREVRKLEEARNAAGAKIEWRFTTADARRKLHRLYPSTSD
ncbi:MAG: IS630 family transposase [Acidobacteria bacterium]|nr:IS630 family transposase [Acidobacteriota bacterium]